MPIQDFNFDLKHQDAIEAMYYIILQSYKTQGNLEVLKSHLSKKEALPEDVDTALKTISEHMGACWDNEHMETIGGDKKEAYQNFSLNFVDVKDRGSLEEMIEKDKLLKEDLARLDKAFRDSMYAGGKKENVTNSTLNDQMEELAPKINDVRETFLTSQNYNLMSLSGMHEIKNLEDLTLNAMKVAAGTLTVHEFRGMLEPEGSSLSDEMYEALDKIERRSEFLTQDDKEALIKEIELIENKGNPLDNITHMMIHKLNEMKLPGLKSDLDYLQQTVLNDQYYSSDVLAQRRVPDLDEDTGNVIMPETEGGGLTPGGDEEYQDEGVEGVSEELKKLLNQQRDRSEAVHHKEPGDPLNLGVNDPEVKTPGGDEEDQPEGVSEELNELLKQRRGRSETVYHKKEEPQNLGKHDPEVGTLGSDEQAELYLEPSIEDVITPGGGPEVIKDKKHETKGQIKSEHDENMDLFYGPPEDDPEVIDVNEQNTAGKDEDHRNRRRSSHETPGGHDPIYDEPDIEDMQTPQGVVRPDTPQGSGSYYGLTVTRKPRVSESFAKDVFNMKQLEKLKSLHKDNNLKGTFTINHDEKIPSATATFKDKNDENVSFTLQGNSISTNTKSTEYDQIIFGHMVGMTMAVVGTDPDKSVITPTGSAKTNESESKSIINDVRTERTKPKLEEKEEEIVRPTDGGGMTFK